MVFLKPLEDQHHPQNDVNRELKKSTLGSLLSLVRVYFQCGIFNAIW